MASRCVDGKDCHDSPPLMLPYSSSAQEEGPPLASAIKHLPPVSEIFIARSDAAIPKEIKGAAPSTPKLNNPLSKQGKFPTQKTTQLSLQNAQTNNYTHLLRIPTNNRRRYPLRTQTQRPQGRAARRHRAITIRTSQMSRTTTLAALTPATLIQPTQFQPTRFRQPWHQ